MEGLSSAVELTCSAWGFAAIVDNPIEHHLHHIHRARQVMIRRLLPPATTILDLGGANAPLYRMGYRHPFERMVMVDLPPEDRHEDYRETLLESPAGLGEVVLRLSDMTRLVGVPDDSFDLVWSGQSIEHVDLEAGARMCAEAFRVLKPGGHFCLDTPNRGITAIHTATCHGGFIHPDHKHEYHADELRSVLESAGFDIAAARGICEMENTHTTGAFNYQDFVLGNPITHEIEAAYILYFDAVKTVTPRTTMQT